MLELRRLGVSWNLLEPPEALLELRSCGGLELRWSLLELRSCGGLELRSCGGLELRWSLLELRRPGVSWNLLEPPEALLELRLMALSELGMKASSLVRDGSSVYVIVDVDL